MSDAVNLGAINGHAVGRILKEAVRRAAAVIRAERSTFEAQIKQGYDGGMDDVCTSADRAAQEVYLRTFLECFPGCGVLAEEDGLRIAPTPPLSAYFTVDPLDGTKAFVRRQSHGVASMVALVDGGDVISAYIADINADEVYGYRPGSTKVHRITRLDSFETLIGGAKAKTSIGEMFGLLRDPPHAYGPESQALVERFSNYEIMGSSIGTWAARLWKREVDALLMPPGFETPWDTTPVLGISQRLGYVSLKPSDRGWVTFDQAAPTKVAQRDHDLLIVHERYVSNGVLKL